MNYNVKRAANNLPLELESKQKHFLLRYGLRNPSSGKGMGFHGILKDDVAGFYADTLDSSYQKIKSIWRRPPPVCDSSGKIRVYILGGLLNPAMSIQGGDFPIILLPSYNQETTNKLSLHRIKAEIAHEVCHVFNFHEHPAHHSASGDWRWFDEGMAVYSESRVFKNNIDHYRFLHDWVIFPEFSLDNPEAEYHASQVVRYLAKRFGEKFVNDVWTDILVNPKPEDPSSYPDSPFAVMNRILSGGLKFISLHNGESDVFSDYCRDAYFLRDPKSHLYAPEVFDRFGERASTENFELQPGSNAEAQSNLDHLACRYFRYSVTPGAASLVLTLEALKEGNSPLKAEVAVVTRDGKNALAKRLVPIPLSSVNDRMRLTGKIDLPKNVEIDHVVVVVTNCGLKRATDNVYESSDDEQEFRLQVIAEG
ncbi:MAG: hypothetical protein AAB401_02215 [Acidobacteriota bacterium]